MRKLLVGIAAAGTALAVAAPASAQFYPQSPYGYGYGYNNYDRWGDPSDFARRLYNVRRSALDRGAYGLANEASSVERQLRMAARGGLDPRETQYFNNRVYRLELQLGRIANRGYGYGGYGYNGYNGFNGYYGDRDRDHRGRWDRDDNDNDDDRD